MPTRVWLGGMNDLPVHWLLAFTWCIGMFRCGRMYAIGLIYLLMCGGVACCGPNVHDTRMSTRHF